MALLAGKTISHFFYVRSLSNRILAPDSNPTATLIRGVVDTVVPVTISAAVDGGWIAQATLPSNWVEGDVVSLRINATKDSYPMSSTVHLGTVDSPIVAAPTASDIRQEIDTNSAKLAAIATAVSDIYDLSGYNPDYPLTENSTAVTISANGKTITVAGDDTIKTYTRTGNTGSTLALRQNGIEANYRNLNNTQTAVASRTPLLIDGLRTQGAFNTFGYEIWDASTSKIRPRNTSQIFDCRIILEVTPSTTGSLLTLDVDIGSTTPILIYSEQIVLSIFQKTTITKSFFLYASPTFVTNGGKVNVSATDPIAITNASIYIYLKGGTP